MKASVTMVAVGAAMALAAVIFASTRSSAAPASRAAQPRQNVLYGHVKSLTRAGRRFELRFDPAWWLTGFTAKRAKLEDTGSSGVPNDYYVVDEGHRLLTYLVPPTAHVAVLTGGGTHTTAITVSELAQIVKGKNPRHRPLSEPKAGFWLQVGSRYPNAVVALTQQYQP